MHSASPLHLGISIHSPRMGRDYRDSAFRWGKRDFNPLSPHGERHSDRDLGNCRNDISIHSPRMGRDSTLAPCR